jgi:hypothetical protein
LSEDLIALLDPNRSYGDRNHDEVVDGVRNGKLRLEEGRRLPVIKDASTNLVVKGTGQPPIPEGLEPQAWGRREFSRRAAEDFDEAYSSLMETVRAGDPRAMKLFFETFLGRPREARDNEDPEALMRLLEAVSQPRVREIPVETHLLSSDSRDP